MAQNKTRDDKNRSWIRAAHEVSAPVAHSAVAILGGRDGHRSRGQSWMRRLFTIIFVLPSQTSRRLIISLVRAVCREGACSKGNPTSAGSSKTLDELSVWAK